MKRRVIALLAAVTMICASFTGCGNKNNKETADTSNTKTESQDKTTTTDSSDKQEDAAETTTVKEIKHFKQFTDRTGNELTSDNEIKKIIAEKIGADCEETWLVGQTAEEAIGLLIASGEYPDFLNYSADLYDAGALVPLEDYIEKYPNLKSLWSEAQYETLRKEDGHIYSIPQFDTINGESTSCRHGGEAFWIQTRVLKWDNYPVIESLDQLFDLLERYYAANPTMDDGTDIIPFGILAYDWTYFCLENPPQFLDGYPNNGRCIVIPETKQVVDYNTTDTAIRYFRKLNEEYKKGIVDQEFITMNKDQFEEKVSSGRVLCFVEQQWDIQTAWDTIKAQGMEDCQYVPLGITIDPGMSEAYGAQSEPAVLTGGISVTTSCKDVDGAMKFLNDLLDPEILRLRYWGVEGVDYCVGDDGIFYRTEEQRAQAVKQEYKDSHMCPYSYMPGYSNGYDFDGINAINPNNQPGEFFASLDKPIQECLEAYGAQTMLQMMDPVTIDTDKEPWYPMWSAVNDLPSGTKTDEIWSKMEACKQEWTPKLVVADDFDKAWADYMVAYEKTGKDDFFKSMQEIVYRRYEMVTGEDIRPEGYVVPEF